MRKLLIGVPVFSLAMAGIVAALIWLLSSSSDPVVNATGPYKHSLVRWELSHFMGKWLYEAGTFIRGKRLSANDEDERLRTYFSLGQEAAKLEEQIDSLSLDSAESQELSQQLRAVNEQRWRLKNTVEAIIERRVGTVLTEGGLERSLPLLGWKLLWPPVDVEFDVPPKVLVVSPRDRITMDKEVLLRGDLSLETIVGMETAVEQHGVASLVVSTGGIATYPSTIPDDSSYGQALEIAAHEWLHQYLFFHPLGRRYFQNEELRTINETVANIAGREIADKALARYPLRSPARNAAIAADASSSGVDFRKELHDLRLAVDQLLSQGQVTEAERLMEEKRQSLAANGYYIRKINQAYFAWHGTYADTPAASSPLGPKIIEVRSLSGSVGDFIQRMARVTSANDVERLLAELRRATQP